VQDQTAIFNVDEHNFVTYVQDSDFEEQGTKIRCTFDMTVDQIREKVREACGLEAGKNFEMIEVQRLRTAYC